MVAKKPIRQIFDFRPIFKMAAIFAKKAPKIHAFFTKMTAVLKIGPKSKIALYNFFPTIYATTWPNFSSIAPPDQNP